MKTIAKFNLDKPDGYVWLGGREDVCGTAYRQKEFRKAISSNGEIHFILEREPQNPHDPNAVRVLIQRGRENFHIGYLPREMAEEVTTLAITGSDFDWFKVLPREIYEDQNILHLSFSLFWPDKKNRESGFDPLSGKYSQPFPPMSSSASKAPPPDDLAPNDIRIRCESCGQSYLVDSSHAGKICNCQKCHAIISIPYPFALGSSASDRPQEPKIMESHCPNCGITCQNDRNNIGEKVICPKCHVSFIFRPESNLILCRGCGKEVSPRASFCISCGEPIASRTVHSLATPSIPQGSIPCKFCGKPTAPNATVCPFCGGKLKEKLWAVTILLWLIMILVIMPIAVLSLGPIGFFIWCVAAIILAFIR